jgi:hypothetical protein
MVEKIYLIQAHQYPKQLLRLINKLNEVNVFFYIHIDLKSNISLFQDIIKGSNIFFIENRVDCIWGDFSQVRATLNMIEQLLSKGHPTNSRIIFLSGQDYPIKPLSYINKFISNNNDNCYINIESMTQSGSHHLKNLKAFKINHSSKRYDFSMVSKYHLKSIIKGLFQGKIRNGNLLLLFKEKKLPLDLLFFRGSNWFSFNYVVLDKVMNFYKVNSEFLDIFFKQTLCPDEIFFQSILMQLKKYDDSINILPSLTYDNWKREGVELPVTFKIDDLQELLVQPEHKLFARKFDENIDSAILQELDKI